MKALQKEFPNSQLEQCPHSETLPQLFGQLFVEGTSSKFDPMKDKETSARDTLATSPVITAGFDSLQASCLGIHNHALAPLSSKAYDFTRDIQPHENFHIATIQQKLIAKSNKNQRVYSVLLAETLRSLRCPQPQRLVEISFSPTKESYIPVSLKGAPKDHVSDLAQELRLLAEAQQPHGFLRVYLLATPSRCTELAAWFEEILWARHGVFEAEDGLYERNIKAFGEGLPAPFIEPCASNETLVDLLARLVFGGQSKPPDVPAQPADASLAITHASNPLLENFDSLQRIFRNLNAQAMAAGIDQLYSLDPIQVLHVSTFQRKLIDRCGGDPDVYSVHLVETMEKLSVCVRDQADYLWCHFLHLHCGFPQPDSDFGGPINNA
ncbi:hypothetical protein E8E11_011003 [Didymella keratinophila]|nr:hypothetical protein E8E11_011003 [Didymella keratinophila]